MGWASEYKRPALLTVLPKESHPPGALEGSRAPVLSNVAYLWAGYVADLPCILHMYTFGGQPFVGAVRALFVPLGDPYFFPEVVGWPTRSLRMSHDNFFFFRFMLFLCLCVCVCTCAHAHVCVCVFVMHTVSEIARKGCWVPWS